MSVDHGHDKLHQGLTYPYVISSGATGKLANKQYNTTILYYSNGFKLSERTRPWNLQLQNQELDRTKGCTRDPVRITVVAHVAHA